MILTAVRIYDGRTEGRSEGREERREEGGVGGWMWINVAADENHSESSFLQRSVRTTGSFITPSLFLHRED